MRRVYAFGRKIFQSCVEEFECGLWLLLRQGESVVG